MKEVCHRDYKLHGSTDMKCLKQAINRQKTEYELLRARDYTRIEVYLGGDEML